MTTALNTPSLHPIRGRARKCGPSALAAITRLTTDQCAAYLRLVTGRRRIHGVDDLEMDAALRLVGWQPIHHSFPADSLPTLAAWRWIRDYSVAYVLVVGHHYVAVANNRVADSGAYFSRRPQPLSTAPNLGLFVRAQIACLPPGAPIPPKTDLFPASLHPHEATHA